MTMIYSNDLSFNAYFDFHFPQTVNFLPSDIYTPCQTKTEYTHANPNIIVNVEYSESVICFTLSDIYTPQPKTESPKQEEEYITIDVENLIAFNKDELNTIPNQVSVELINFEEEDNTLSEFYADCFSVADVDDIPNYYKLEDCFSEDDILLIPPDLSPLNKLKQELDKLGAWARQSA
jgi:hypothetical protein